jgi:hypothetical protein
VTRRDSDRDVPPPGTTYIPTPRVPGDDTQTWPIPKTVPQPAGYPPTATETPQPRQCRHLLARGFDAGTWACTRRAGHPGRIHRDVTGTGGVWECKDTSPADGLPTACRSLLRYT